MPCRRIDVEVEQLTEVALVRRREQQRVAVRCQRAALLEQHRALRGRLAEIEPGVEHDLLGRQTRGLGAPGALEEELGHVAQQVVVVRVGIGDTRAPPDVGGDDGGVVLGRDREVVGITEAADVVADHRAGLARSVEHGRAPRVARDRDVEPGVQGLDRSDDPVELFVLGHVGARTGLHAADIEEIGTGLHELVRAPEQRAERECRAPVVEGVGRAVEDAHHERAGGEVVDLVTEADSGRHRGAGYAPWCSAPPRGRRRRRSRTSPRRCRRRAEPVTRRRRRRGGRAAAPRVGTRRGSRRTTGDRPPRTVSSAPATITPRW